MTAPRTTAEKSQGSVALATELLRLYERAIDLRRLSVAEHLLQALETLAESEQRCRCILDQAYARIATLSRADP